uniref:Uncharacterized protein n=1 Tax=Ralstonia solanacearum TaxID=305 RepID=A0A0S4V8N5_RALSL|nr:protein of unknown function [Ralstonia solanacearum]
MRDWRFVQTRLHIDCGVHDRKLVCNRGTRRAYDVIDQQLTIHGGDGIHLDRLVVDDHEGRVLRSQQVVVCGIANGFASHGHLQSKGWISAAQRFRTDGAPYMPRKDVPIAAEAWRHHRSEKTPPVVP